MYTCHVVYVEDDLFNAEPTVTETLSNNQELPTQGIYLLLYSLALRTLSLSPFVLIKKRTFIASGIDGTNFIRDKSIDYRWSEMDCVIFGT